MAFLSWTWKFGGANASEQMPMVNKSAHRVEDSAAATEMLRLELERGQRELNECHKRMRELQQGEMLLAGENRLLQMVARGELLRKTARKSFSPFIKS